MIFMSLFFILIYNGSTRQSLDTSAVIITLTTRYEALPRK
jgi:hypothetical protein